MLRGSVLFPDRLLHKLHGRGLAKSTICWISLSLPLFTHLLSPLSPLVCLFSLLYYKYRSRHTAILRLFTKQELLLVRTESSVKASRHVLSFFFLPSFFFFAEHLLAEIFRDGAVFSQRTCFSCH